MVVMWNGPSRITWNCLLRWRKVKFSPQTSDLPLISLPVQHCQPLSGENPAVHVSGGELPDSGVAQDLEPPEPSHRKLLIEVTLSGKTSGVAEVNMVEVAVELTESLDDVWLVVRDVVVDPHPPARVEAAGRLRQGLQQPQEPLNGVRGQPGVTQVSAALG